MTKTESTVTDKSNEKSLRKVYFLIVSLCAIAMVISSWGTGYHSDEMDSAFNGKAVMKYYKTLGKDTSYRRPPLPDGTYVYSIIKTYGAVYEIGINAVADLFPEKYFFDIRHIFIQLSGCLAMFIASSLVYFLTRSYLLSSLAFLFIYFCPIFFGNSMMNSKDIPFALFYMASVYFTAKSISKNAQRADYILLIASLCMTCSCRMAGFILTGIVAFILAYQKLQPILKGKMNTWDFKPFLKAIPKISLVVVCPVIFVIITNPFILESPIKNFLYCFSVGKKFPIAVLVNFEGELTRSVDIPRRYLLKWMFLTIPALPLAICSYGIINSAFKFLFKKVDLTQLLLFMAVVGPLFIAIFTNVPAYNRWRHFLFLFPPAMVLGMLNLGKLPLTKFKPVFVFIAGAAMLLHPIYWSIKNHPFEYIYFNELSGGFAKCYDEYETDGWQMSVRIASNWLVKQDFYKNSKDKTIASNAATAVDYEIHNVLGMKDVKVNAAGFKSFFAKEWKFLILNVNFMPPEFLQNFYEKLEPVYAVKVDGRPVCVVMVDTVRNDLKAYNAMSANRFKEADSLAAEALKIYHFSERLIEIRAFSIASLCSGEDCSKFLDNALNTFPNNPNLDYYKGIYLARTGQYKPAIEKIQLALDKGLQPEKDVFNTLSMLFNLIGDKVNEEIAKKLASEMKK